ncbi:MAG: Gfo/Idh/MocA family oxidoreductase [Microbacterium sp.]
MTRRARIAVLGAGWWSRTVHLPALARNPRAELVAVCDPDESRSRSAASTFGGKAFTDVDELFTRASLDGVVIATPHTTHFAAAQAALRVGMHVLVEKPLATTAADAWTLVELARERSCLLAAGLTYQYAAAAPRIRDAVRTDIGELRSINAEFSSTTLSLFRVVDPADARLDDAAVPHGTTYSDPKTGGGQAHTQMTHLLGGVLWAAGRQAIDVSAFTAHHGLAVDLVDAVAFSLDGGALGAASSTGTTPPGVAPRHRIRFHGTRGMVEWDMLRAEAVVHLEGGLMRAIDNPVDSPSYAKERVTESFVESILDGTPTPAPAFDAAASVALIEATLLSARERRVVAVAQAPAGVFESIPS